MGGQGQDGSETPGGDNRFALLGEYVLARVRDVSRSILERVRRVAPDVADPEKPSHQPDLDQQPA
jgi:hypothetical protein